MDFVDRFALAPQLTLGTATMTLVRTVLKACNSPHTRRSYAKAIDELENFAEGRALSRLLLLDWRCAMEAGYLSPATINLRLTAVRRLVREARRAQLLDANDAASLQDVPNLPQRGTRTGTWLSAEQCRQLLGVPRRNTLRGQRNYCVLAILLGCALRRSELAALTVEHLQKRNDRWILENLRGKGGRVRQVAVPEWVMEAVADWLVASKIRSGRLIRQLTCDPVGLSDDSIMEIVSKAAAKIGVPNFTPHDLRRTCAKLARKNGGELEQIQFLLGHSSLVTTERYLGSAQNLVQAVNDNLGF